MHYPQMTLQHHAKFENDPMNGLGDTAWDGRTDIHGSFQDSTSARGTKWNKFRKHHNGILEVQLLQSEFIGTVSQW